MHLHNKNEVWIEMASNTYQNRHRGRQSISDKERPRGLRENTGRAQPGSQLWNLTGRIRKSNVPCRWHKVSCAMCNILYWSSVGFCFSCNLCVLCGSLVPSLDSISISSLLLLHLNISHTGLIFIFISFISKFWNMN